mmetsp:Transcript_23053/g.39549  ORF Transcript_23053/g.39549 Transcript_23053/m.39549 type:complete len:84 (+) Transcript_23053:401-652(+)
MPQMQQGGHSQACAKWVQNEKNWKATQDPPNKCAAEGGRVMCACPKQEPAMCASGAQPGGKSKAGEGNVHVYRVGQGGQENVP